MSVYSSAILWAIVCVSFAQAAKKGAKSVDGNAFAYPGAYIYPYKNINTQMMNCAGEICWVHRALLVPWQVGSEETPRPGLAAKDAVNQLELQNYVTSISN
jgi:hypothetical protein